MHSFSTAVTGCPATRDVAIFIASSLAAVVALLMWPSSGQIIVRMWASASAWTRCEIADRLEPFRTTNTMHGRIAVVTGWIVTAATA